MLLSNHYEPIISREKLLSSSSSYQHLTVQIAVTISVYRCVDYIDKMYYASSFTLTGKYCLTISAYISNSYVHYIHYLRNPYTHTHTRGQHYTKDEQSRASYIYTYVMAYICLYTFLNFKQIKLIYYCVYHHTAYNIMTLHTHLSR